MQVGVFLFSFALRDYLALGKFQNMRAQSPRLPFLLSATASLAGLLKLTLNLDKSLEGLTKLIESYYTHDHRLLQGKIQIRTSQRKTCIGQTLGGFHNLRFHCFQDSNLVALIHDNTQRLFLPSWLSSPMLWCLELLLKLYYTGKIE